MEDGIQVVAGHYVVQIPWDALSAEVETITSLLINESAAPSKWIDVALSYLQKGDLDSFDKILLCVDLTGYWPWNPAPSKPTAGRGSTRNLMRSNEGAFCRKLTTLEEPKNAPDYELQQLRAVQVQSRCFRVQTKLDEYVNGDNRDPMTLDKISSSANHPLTAAESLHPNDVQLLLTRAQYQATVSENSMAAKGTLQRAKGVGAKRTVAPNLALAQVYSHRISNQLHCDRVYGVSELRSQWYPAWH